MLTLRFESDTRSSDAADIVFMIEAKSFRARTHRDGCVDIYIANEHGVDIAHPVSGSLGGYDRCFVMNEAGQTVAKFAASAPGTLLPVAEAA